MLKKISQLVLCLAVFALLGCNLLMMRQLDESEEILSPSTALVSPKMDFNKIRAVAVFPLFPGVDILSQYPTMHYTASRIIEDPEFAEQACHTLCSELKVKQSQWKIYGYKDVVETIFKKDLGRGYKNFQADFNTARGQIKTVFLTKESKRFLKQLSSEMQVDAFIFGSYNLTKGKTVVQHPLFGPRYQNALQCSVNVVLYQTSMEEIWWQASDNKQSNDKNKLISSISKSLASYVGKGTLRQL